MTKPKKPEFELPDIIPEAWCVHRGCIAPARWQIDGEDWCEQHRPLSREELIARGLAPSSWRADD